MKVFTFRYEKNAVKTGVQRMLEAAKTGVPYIREHEMVCDSLETLIRVVSQKGKFETFEGVIAYRPESLYELSQLLGKDQGQVLKEARSLEAMGLIKLVPNNDGAREKLKPEPLYDKIVFEVEPKRVAKSD